MIIYEVNIKANNSIMEEYGLWLKEHIKEILEIPGFKNAYVFRDGDKYCIQYWLFTMEDLDNYLENYAEDMRDKGVERFNDQFSASRRIMELQEEILIH